MLNEKAAEFSQTRARLGFHARLGRSKQSCHSGKYYSLQHFFNIGNQLWNLQRVALFNRFDVVFIIEPFWSRYLHILCKFSLRLVNEILASQLPVIAFSPERGGREMGLIYPLPKRSRSNLFFFVPGIDAMTHSTSAACVALAWPASFHWHSKKVLTPTSLFFFGLSLKVAYLDTIAHFQYDQF